MPGFVGIIRRSNEKSFLTSFGVRLDTLVGLLRAPPHIASAGQIHYTPPVEYPFPPVGIVGAADGKNRRAFLCLELESVFTDFPR